MGPGFQLLYAIIIVTIILINLFIVLIPEISRAWWKGQPDVDHEKLSVWRWRSTSTSRKAQSDWRRPWKSQSGRRGPWKAQSGRSISEFSFIYLAHTHTHHTHKHTHFRERREREREREMSTRLRFFTCQRWPVENLGRWSLMLSTLSASGFTDLFITLSK